jgi:outer membrane protein
MSYRPSRVLALVLALGSLVAVARPSPSLAADGRAPKIAVVDLQRAVLETEDGLRAQSTLRKYFERRQAELNGRQEELLKKKEDLEKQAKVLSKEALARALDDWQRQLNELQGVYVSYENERVKKQNDVTAPIYARVTSLLRKVAQRDGYDLVLERQAVPYSKAELDVTDQLIVMYNSNEEGAAEPAAAPPAGSGAPAAPSAPPAAPRPAASK